MFGGKSDAEYKGVAEFFHFLSQTSIQARLHQVSGYLPVTMAAYEETKKSGFYEKNPGRETPILQMMGKAPTENSKGVRLVNLPQVRDIMNEEFEAMLAGKEDAKTALDKAVERGQRSDQAGHWQIILDRRLLHSKAAGGNLPSPFFPQGVPPLQSVVFPNRILPYFLVAPQIILTVLFFLLASQSGALSICHARGSLRASKHLCGHGKFFSAISADEKLSECFAGHRYFQPGNGAVGYGACLGTGHGC